MNLVARISAAIDADDTAEVARLRAEALDARRRLLEADLADFRAGDARWQALEARAEQLAGYWLDWTPLAEHWREAAREVLGGDVASWPEGFEAVLVEVFEVSL